MPANGESINTLVGLVLALTRLAMRFDLHGARAWSSAILACTDFDRGKGRGELVLTLLGPLRGDWYAELSRGADRNLVPLLEPPPVVGGHRGYAAQVALLMDFVGVVDEARMELAEAGGVRVPLVAPYGASWSRMAERSGMPVTGLSRVLDEWQNLGVVAALAPDVWTLGQRYGAELTMLTDGGRLSRRAKAAGKASARRRRWRHGWRPTESA